MDVSASDEAQQSWWKRYRWTIIALVAIVLLAGALRVGFNYEPALNGGELRYAGNDDYYHLRVVEKVQKTGDHVVGDDLLNYPLPARNPRPPAYDWHVAIIGQIWGFLTGEASPGQPALDGGRHALEWGSALWGALTVIPVWLLGRTTFGNKAGLWAAFLLAASPAHIQRSGFGLGDHDAFIVFFLVLGTYFLVRSLQLTRDDVRVGSWAGPSSILNGFSEYAHAHGEGLAYAFLAAVSWATIALAWEGFPYVLAIYAVYYTFQLVSNQMRRRDSTGDFLVFSIIMGTILALAVPYYWITGNISTTLTSAVYISLGLIVLSLALIPTRDLPAILVLPAFALVLALGILVLTLVFPDVGRQLVTANGYFLQSKLYSTIAEAQRTELGVFVFSIGVMTFFFALIGFVMATLRYFKLKERAMLFFVGWGLISIYMGFAATRFVFNAAPVFAIFAGWVTQRLIGWMNFRERLKNFQSLRHESLFKATRSTLGTKQIVGSLFILLTLIVPALWFSVDAGIPSEARLNYRNNYPGAREFIDKRTGAFGQGFLEKSWIEVYGWLDQQDTNLPEEKRPAHIAWWDYGFWEVAIAHHPTVADNFQNGHQLAGRFLAAQSEEEAVDWLSIRLLEGDRGRHARQLSPQVLNFLSSKNASLAGALQPVVGPDHYDEALAVLQSQVRGLDAAVDFYDGLRAVTGYSIEYFIVDSRMLPYDNPQTPGIDSGSILYAPIYLANKNPDDFVQTVYLDSSNNEYAVEAYGVDGQGNSIQQRPPKIVDTQDHCYFVAGGEIYRASSDCQRIDYNYNQGKGIPLRDNRLKFKDAYYQTMFYRGFVGGEKPAFGDYSNEFLSGQETAGKGLQHFRLVNGTNSVKLLQYYSGAVVRGKVLLASGEPLAGRSVVAQDAKGIDHARSTIGPDGSYEVKVPFTLSGENGTRVAVKDGENEIANQTVTVTKDQAQRRGDYNLTLDFRIQPANLQGLVYRDVDGDRQFNATVDQALSGAEALVDGRNYTTDASGLFQATQVMPGSKTVTASKPGFTAGSASVSLAPGGSGTVTIALAPAPVAVNGTLKDEATGQPVGGLLVTFTADHPEQDKTVNGSAVADASGVFSANLQPGGTYTVSINDTVTRDNVTARYAGTATVTVPVGPTPVQMGDVLVRRIA